MIAKKLAHHAKQHLIRHRYQREGTQNARVVVDGNEMLGFCSNDYLGLANHPAVIKAWQEGAELYGVGSGASQMIIGHHKAHRELEDALAEFLQRPRALVYSTGFMTNLGVLTALVNRDDCIIEDKLNHASLIDAGRYSDGTLKRYRHADIDDMVRCLQTPCRGQRYLVSDGVFSMDGDFAPLPEIIAQRQQAQIMIDDAHGIGVLGKAGRGIVEHFDCNADVDILTGTFGKSLGGFGAFVAGSDTLIEYLIQFSRTYIYTTAMPPALAHANRIALQTMQRETWRRDKLHTLIGYFQQQAKSHDLPITPSITAIQPLVIGTAEDTITVTEALRKRGIFVTAIRPPTVTAGTSRLRLTLNAQHSEADIDFLVEALAEVVPNHVFA